MKKLGIDARLINQTGVGTYLKNLLYFLEKILPEDIELNVYLRSVDQNKINFFKKNIHKKIADYHWHSLNEQLGFLIQLCRDRLDLMHFTYFSLPLFYPGKFITTIHDLIPWMYKTGKASTHNRWFYEIKYLFYKLIILNQVKRAVQIITPTQAVKNDLLRIFGNQLDSKVKVIHEGVNYLLKEVMPNNSLKEKYRDGYFLYVGNFYPHKNIEMLVKAFKKLKNERLILVGPKDYFSQKIINLVNELGLEKQIIFIVGADLADIRYLYEHCRALIHPSLAEGFGLPIIEAMYFKKPIIASRISPFQEIIGKNYFPFDPQQEKSLLENIQELVNKKIITVDYGDFENEFSFQKMASETLKIYEKKS